MVTDSSPLDDDQPTGQDPTEQDPADQNPAGSGSATEEPSRTAAGRSEQGPLMQPVQAFTELGQLVVGSTPLGQVLERVAQLAKACVPGAEEVSVTLIEGDSGASTAAFTGSLAAQLDERQYESGYGPCLDAAEAAQTIRINDTSAEGVYTDFAAIAARQGVRSTVSVGMPMPQRIVGALNVYRLDDRVMDTDSVQLLKVFAGYAAIAVANHSLYASSVALSAHLQTAMASRAVIEQAKGILMGQLHCTAEEAFQHLVTQSQRTSRKLREVATDVVAAV